MLWTLVYILVTQGSAGSLQTDTWPTGLRFSTQQECLATASDAAPKMMSAGSTYVGPSGGIAGPNPNAITVQPICVPASK